MPVLPTPATGLAVTGGGVLYVRHAAAWEPVSSGDGGVIEDWDGTDGAAWPAQWTASAPNGGLHDIQSNKGRQLTGTGGGYTDYCRALLADVVAADFDITVDVDLVGTIEAYTSLHFRSDGVWNGNDSTNNGWRVFFAQGGSQFWHVGHWSGGGGETNLTGDQARTTHDTTQHIRVQCAGSAVKVKLWADAEPEPGTWTFETTDATHASLTRMAVTVHGGADAGQKTVRWDNLTDVS